MIVGGGHGLLHEVLRVRGVGWARRGHVLRVRGTHLTRVGPGGGVIPVVVGMQYPALHALRLVQVMVVAAVRLLVLFMVMGMLVGRACGRVDSFHPGAGSGARVQPPIPGVTRAVPSRSIHCSRGGGGARVEAAGGHREALGLVQGMVEVMQMVVVVVVRGFGRRVGAGARAVTKGVFHKRVHVVHADRGTVGLGQGREAGTHTPSL